MRKAVAAEESKALPTVGHDHMRWGLVWALPPTDCVLRAQQASPEGLL